jgi:hypothetical protein
MKREGDAADRYVVDFHSHQLTKGFGDQVSIAEFNR